MFSDATAERQLDRSFVRDQGLVLDAGLRPAGIVDVDNSCTGGFSALRLATLATLGGAGTVLAMGVECVRSGDRADTLAGIEGGYRSSTAR